MAAGKPCVGFHAASDSDAGPVIEPHLYQLGTDPVSVFCVVWSMPDDWMALADRKQTVFFTQNGGPIWQ